jgi:DNA-binding NarL/FixJ family response regulator
MADMPECNKTAPINVLLADDDELILQGLATVLGVREDIRIVGTAKNGAQVLQLSRSLEGGERPQVAVLDIRMPVLDGIKAAAGMLEDGWCSPLLLTTFDEPELIARALEVGARGYILKSALPDQIHAAILTVAHGGSVFAPDIVAFIRERVHIPTSAAFERLTDRERDIVRLIAEGCSNAQIADQLGLAEGTVRNHISTILAKCGLEHRTQIAVRYLAG